MTDRQLFVIGVALISLSVILPLVNLIEGSAATSKSPNNRFPTSQQPSATPQISNSINASSQSARSSLDRSESQVVLERAQRDRAQQEAATLAAQREAALRLKERAKQVLNDEHGRAYRAKEDRLEEARLKKGREIDTLNSNRGGAFLSAGEAFREGSVAANEAFRENTMKFGYRQAGPEAESRSNILRRNREQAIDTAQREYEEGMSRVERQFRDDTVTANDTYRQQIELSNERYMKATGERPK